MDTDRRRRADSGFTLIELLIVVAIIGILAAAAIPALQRALLKSRISRLKDSARTLHSAFLQYHTDNSSFPSTSTPASRAFNRRTLAPLTTGRYLTTAAPILQDLKDRQVTDYDSPNVGSSDSEYWAILTLKVLPAVQVVVADTTQFPGFTGQNIGGAYFLVDGTLLPLDDDVLSRLGR